MGLWAFILIWCSTFSILVNVGLRLTLGFLTFSPSRVSPFNHIGTLPLQRKHSQPRVLLFCPFLYRRFFFLTGHAYLEPLPGTLARKTFDTRTILVLQSSEPVLTIGSDTTCQEQGNKGKNKGEKK